MGGDPIHSFGMYRIYGQLLEELLDDARHVRS